METDYPINRDELYILLKGNNYFYPLTSDQACFKNKYRSLTLENARNLSEKVLVLPLYEELELEEIKKITKIIESPKDYL